MHQAVDEQELQRKSKGEIAMDALIMSCGTGGGHDAAAKALEEELLRRGHAVCRINPYTLKSEKFAHKIDQSYIKLVQRVPKAFGAV